MSDKELYNKDGVPINWNGNYWQTYKMMLSMAIQDMDDGLWNVACGQIDGSYTSAEGKLKLEEAERKIKKTIMMSLSAELAELYRREPTGSALYKALCDRNENRSNPVAVFHAIQRLEEELCGEAVHLRQSPPIPSQGFEVIRLDRQCGPSVHTRRR